MNFLSNNMQDQRFIHSLVNPFYPTKHQSHRHCFLSPYINSYRGRRNANGLVDYTAKSIFLHMAQRPQPASLSVLQPRSTDVFSALYHGLRTSDLLLSTLSFAGIISKAVPALLAGIPFQAAQTFKVHEICMWSAVATLLVMIVVLGAHMWWVKWPDLIQGNDGTLAVTAYYVCDSFMTRDFERLSLLSREERDRRVEGMKRLYRLGWIVGVSGEVRVGVDYAEGEKGFQLKSLGGPGMGFGGGKRPK